MSTIFFSYGQINYSIPDSLSNLKYREDQFYIGANYLVIQSDNELINQNDFSSQIHFGFLRDIPLTKKGNWSIALGLGSSYTQFQSNLDYRTGSISSNFNSAKYISLNLPFEVRWRSSSSTSFSFWRIYLGSQLQYNFISEDLNMLKKLTTVSTINLGYNTWNFSVGYDFYNRFINSEDNFSNQFKLLTVGLIFYVL
ncbi:hypothetical protein N9T93_01105 [Flavobacteriaceae bacterium]|nr:hypothetical protein [Flavobacteriaceae bacterium]